VSQGLRVATTSSHIPGYLTVSNIYNNVGDTLDVTSITPSTFSQYNTLYRIATVDNSKRITVSSASTVSSVSTAGIGSTVAATGNVILTGRTLNVSSIVHSNTTGIATFTTVQNHGLLVDNKIVVGGADASFFNKQFIVSTYSMSESFK
jgi:hypothetical protein